MDGPQLICCCISKRALRTLRDVKPLLKPYAARSLSTPIPPPTPKLAIRWTAYNWSKGIPVRKYYGVDEDLAVFLKAVKSAHASADCLERTYDEAFWSMNLGFKSRCIIRNWYTLGPPPLSEYRLTFGKHRGKLLDEVPDVYLVKYLVPRRKGQSLRSECPIVLDALNDFLKRHPGIKSQAGPKKAKPLKGEVAQAPEARK
ncbi:hypothetical protein FB567DRAFT_114565 [Paraphoma chrysanthemicola]|uniref:Uncharacterized protein n=1 Tax=Paraphoma chrysanthemicola TaxID=798071 RepID=A0A8K0R2M7_9PLEO|nr:hypothetical protein FB567DRAFT_114565 [Paraphoma chrysanthemicola]